MQIAAGADLHWTPLHALASHRGIVSGTDTTLILLAAGADPSHVAPDGQSALSLAEAAWAEHGGQHSGFELHMISVAKRGNYPLDIGDDRSPLPALRALAEARLLAETAHPAKPATRILAL